MDAIFSYLYANADQAHFILFGLLMLAGLNIPISEDVVLIGGGAIASIYIPEHTLRLYLWLFFGCLLSGWESYWLGRLLGPKLQNVRFFKHIISHEKVEKIKGYFERYGIYTFLVGRFIPGGIRNGLLMASGLTKMYFPLFILRDTTALVLSTCILFSIGLTFGENLDLILSYVRLYSFALTMIVALIVAGIIGFLLTKKHQAEC